jgi:Na+-driven multidrug efflux pump
MFMRTVLIFFPLAGFQIVSSNMFSAIGKPVKGTILSLTRQVIVFIPLVLILPVFWGLNGIMIAAPVSDGISFITVLIFIIREMKSMGKDGGYDKG